ncbi:cytosine permease [Thermaerobacter subterraneus]|uniref:Purine-cytosine permease-like transporter n=1 Tax=Thermaerobacter subterraneus DSM 13965 TaxID=867903 RepID=K6QF77_9FIRM|nr:cytosine permease [Thermaerobacter subterraneus]EKP95616.1 purine-cytosine permease-like transporter [Thermaerobacter subterraneus DSM 13965]
MNRGTGVMQDGRSNKGRVDPDFPLTHVPATARQGLWSVSIILLGFTFFTPTMLAGARLATAFPFAELVQIIIFGSLLLAGYVGVLSAIGARTGLTTVLMSRYTLGHYGAKWADLLLGGTQVGWYGVTAGVMGSLLAVALGVGSVIGIKILVVLAGVLMGITAYYGYKGMELLSAVSVPLLLIMAAWVTLRSVAEVGGWTGLLAMEPQNSMSLAAAITVIVGTFASGGTQAPNWTRFARSAGVAFWAALIAFLLGNGAMLFFGAVGSTAYPASQGDFVNILYEMGLIVWGVIFLILNLWTTNDNAAYAFGVAGAEFFNIPNKKPFVVAGVATGTLLAVLGIDQALIPWLVALGVLIPPLGGTIIGDYFFVWRQQLPRLDCVQFRAVRWDAVLAYLLGTAAALWSSSAGILVPPLVGIVVAALAVPALRAVFLGLGRAQEHRIAEEPIAPEPA